MCGIFFSKMVVDDRVLFEQRVRQSIRHRGTEEPRLLWLDGMLFAHALLPVQGDGPVSQPLCSGRHVLLFGGELWNHPGNASDTLFLLEALAQSKALGTTLNQLRGMFALVWYDAGEGLIHFASDVFGEVPLYFTNVEQELCVATEIKQLVVQGLTLKQIRPALPGVLYTFDLRDHTLKTTEYWHWNFSNDQTVFEQDRLLNLISKSARAKYFSNSMQESALLLSGGLDSTIMAYELSRLGLKETFTVAAYEEAHDFKAAEAVCKELNLHFHPIIAHDLVPDCAIAATEVSNRSILEEMCCHIVLGNILRERGIRVLFSGCGADEIFIGYQHLLRFRSKTTRRGLQEEFVKNYHRMDLRAFNKVYMLNAIELRNPFLSADLLDYTSTLDVDSLLIGRRREMKLALRLAYEPLLGNVTKEPKLIARETMGAKQQLQDQYGESPLVFKKRWKEIFETPAEIQKLVERAKTLN